MAEADDGAEAERAALREATALLEGACERVEEVELEERGEGAGAAVRRRGTEAEGVAEADDGAEGVPKLLRDWAAEAQSLAVAVGLRMAVPAREVEGGALPVAGVEGRADFVEVGEGVGGEESVADGG